MWFMQLCDCFLLPLECCKILPDSLSKASATLTQTIGDGSVYISKFQGYADKETCSDSYLTRGCKPVFPCLLDSPQCITSSYPSLGKLLCLRAGGK